MNYRPTINAKSLQVVTSLINFRKFSQKDVSNFHKVWAAEKKMKNCFDIRITAKEWINGIQKIMFEFMITQMTVATLPIV